MAQTPITKEGTVTLRGIAFPVDNIRAAMLETGGIPVSDPEINSALDRSLTAHFLTSDEKPEAMAIEAVPDYWFIPISINLHIVQGVVDSLSNAWIYFAVEKKKMFNA